MAHILLIEDEEAFRRILAKALERADHEVTSAPNGRMALDLARGSSFDIVLTDLLMPEKDGMETIIALRQSMPRHRIIAMSGGGRIAARDYLALAQKLGAEHTLNKPFTNDELLQTIERALDGAPKENN